MAVRYSVVSFPGQRKKDKYNEGHFKALKAPAHRRCPVNAFYRWVALQPFHRHDDSPVFDRAMRKNSLNLTNWMPIASI